jgi:hypothetical protein
VFPARPVFERKIHTLLESAREQLARRKGLLPGKKQSGRSLRTSSKKRRPHRR